MDASRFHGGRQDLLALPAARDYFPNQALLIWSFDARHERYRVAVDPDEHADLAAREPARVVEMMQRLEQRLAEQNGRFGFADEATLVASGGFESQGDETHRTWRASAT